MAHHAYRLNKAELTLSNFIFSLIGHPVLNGL